MRRFATAVSALVALAAAGPAQAADINVSTTDDPLAAGPQCSLRQAIEAANTDLPFGACGAGSGADVIHVPANVQRYKLLLPLGVQPDKLEGDLDITTAMTIAGAGREATVLDGNGIDRVLEIAGAAPAVTIKDLTITGGRAPSGLDGADGTNGIGSDPLGKTGTGGAFGGGIENGSGTLTLDNVVVSGNSAGDGGDGGDGAIADPGSPINTQAFAGAGSAGGRGGGIATLGPLVVENSLIEDNAGGSGGSGGQGGTGGAATFFNDPGGDAHGGDGGRGGNGGAIAGFGASAPVTITDSVMRDNRAGDGGVAGMGGTGGEGGDKSGPPPPGAGGRGAGGFGGDGGDGGGVASASSITLARSVISGNGSGDAGPGGQGGTGGARGAGDSEDGGSGDGGVGGDGGRGGGLKISGGTLDISRSEISENSTGRSGNGGTGGAGGASSTGAPGDSRGGSGALSGPGGGMYADGAVSGSITDTTVALNATGDGGRGGPGGTGPATSQGGNGGVPGSAAVAFAPPATATLDRLTVAQNTFGSPGRGGEAGTAPVRNAGNEGFPLSISAGIAGNNTLLRRSIVAGNTGVQCGGSYAPGSGDVIVFGGAAVCPSISVDPLLGPLASNGGPTRTMIPGAGSPAIDAVAGPCGTTDQRGVTRPIGAKCDLGAVERSLPGATTGAASGVNSSSAALAGSVNPGQVPTSYRFDYGTTAAYGSSTAATSAGSGGASVAAAASLSGLAPGTTYHYRLRATSPDGTGAGADRTFTTAAGPPSPKPAFAGVTILSRSARLDAKGRAPVKLTCAAGTVGSCRGTLSLTRVIAVRRRGKRVRKTETIGKARFSIAPAKTKTVKVAIKPSARRKTVKATARTIAKDANAAAKTRTRKITLKPAPRRR